MDLSQFKVYCDDFKNTLVKDLFKIPERDLDLLKNDNIGKTDFDVMLFESNTEEHNK